MGIGFSHGDASWAYWGFERFRHRIACAAGYNLDEFKGYCDDTGKPGWRDWPKKSPIEKLFALPDADGELSPQDCKLLAPAIRALLPLLESEKMPDDRDVWCGNLLADGMEEAARKNQSFETC